MMQSLLSAGSNIATETWRQLRLRAIFDYCKWDAQCGDVAVLAKFPLLLSAATMRQLAELAEALTREALAAEAEIIGSRELMARLSVPAAIRKCLGMANHEPETEHVRVMRFDFHYTTQGWQISEVNADVPGGYVEASGWNTLFAAHHGLGEAPPDPTREYANAISASLPRGSLIALAHASVYSEDRQVMVHIGRELQRLGMRVCLVGPQNLSWCDNRAYLRTSFASGTPGLVVRLSPAEWLPRDGDPSNWAPWFGGSKTPLSNPGRALVLQSKRFPFVWDALSCAVPTWRRLLPESRCPSQVYGINNGEWVVKPAFGRVGEDVGIPGVTGVGEYRRILEAVRSRPEQWMAQRRFEIVPVATDEGEVFPCIGVYTVDGKFAGLYGRAARSPLVNENALDVAVLISNDGSGRAQ